MRRHSGRAGSRRDGEDRRHAGWVLVLLAVASVGFVGLVAVPERATAYTPHSPIVIIGDAQFTTANGVTGGSGTPSDPYVIDGWEITTWPWIGIQIWSTTAHFVIRDVYIHSPSGNPYNYGIILSGVQNGQVENATIADNGGGISVEGSTNVTIVRNRLANNHGGSPVARDYNAGVVVWESTLVTIAENTFTDDGVLLLGSDLVHFTGQTITPDNLVNGLPLYYYKDCSGLQVDGIAVGQLLVANCTAVQATNLGIADTAAAVELAFSRDVVLSGNNLTSNTFGVMLHSSANATLSSSNMSTNGRDGVRLINADNVTLVGNDLFGNGWSGISVHVYLPTNYTSVTIEDNNASSNYRGVFADGSNATTMSLIVTNNTFSQNSVGVYLWGTRTATVHHNSFLDNTFLQAAVNGGVGNAWDAGCPSGGNFWSDFAGTDAVECITGGPGQDGLGDTPYAISGGAQDRFPLMRPRHRIVVDTNPTGLQVRVDGVDRTAPYPLWCDPGTTHALEAPWTQVIDPSSRHVFQGWSDGGAQAHDIVCNSPRTVTANYGTEYRLVFNTSPTGLTILLDGVPYVVPVTLWCAAGSVHLAQAPTPIGPTPDRRYVFRQWQDGSINNPRVVLCDAPGNYMAEYGAEYRLTLDTSPTGLTVIVDGTTLATPQQRWCADGAALTIGTDSPQFIGSDRYEFDSWSDGGTQTHTITCSAPTNYTAFFLGPFLGTPSVTVLFPNGGEYWTGGSAHSITWTMSDPEDAALTVSVDLSTDGGLTFPYHLFSAVRATGTNTFSWVLPVVDTYTARIRVCVLDSGGLSACDLSDADFTVDSTQPVLLAVQPLDGATNVGPNATVVLTFSERMNAVTTMDAVTIMPTVAGMTSTWDTDARILTVEFPSPLAQNTDYVVTVGCEARDASDPGNPVEGCPGSTTRIQFRTEIVAAPPVANAAAVTGGRVGVPVTLDGRGSTGEISTWMWTITDHSGAVVATLEGALVTYTFAESGAYGVTLRVTDAYERTDEYLFDVAVQAGGGDGNARVLTIVTAAVLATILFAASEPGRVALMTATVGRIYAGKPKDERDSEIRGAILYYVRVHPGDTYMDIKRNLVLNDGAITYHLARLEKDKLIRSLVRGARKRYYPAEMRVPLENGGELHEIQQRILRVVTASPGMPVSVLAEQLGVSTQLALYHLRKLSQAQQVNLERTGFRLRAYPGREGN